jgi:hypothetical protein
MAGRGPKLTGQFGGIRVDGIRRAGESAGGTPRTRHRSIHTSRNPPTARLPPAGSGAAGGRSGHHEAAGGRGHRAEHEDNPAPERAGRDDDAATVTTASASSRWSSRSGTCDPVRHDSGKLR